MTGEFGNFWHHLFRRDGLPADFRFDMVLICGAGNNATIVYLNLLALLPKRKADEGQGLSLWMIHAPNFQSGKKDGAFHQSLDMGVMPMLSDDRGQRFKSGEDGCIRIGFKLGAALQFRCQADCGNRLRFFRPTQNGSSQCIQKILHGFSFPRLLIISFLS